jgi:AcrR family transcriptional regulator
MPRKPAPKDPPRKRRSALEAREAILDSAERRLVASGPAGIRLQEVAADVGVSHPTVLHHFGNREALVEAVVARALDSLHTGLLGAVRDAAGGPHQVVALLDSVFDALVSGGHGRAFLWLALSGHTDTVDELRVRSVAEAVHEVRRMRRSGKKRMPPFEDTYFTVLLPALALLSMSVLGHAAGTPGDDDEPRRFRAWLARLIHEHLERA